MTTDTLQPLRYRGQTSIYVDIAVRGSDEHLGLSLQYGAHPSGIGCLIARFVAHGNVVPAKFTHFAYREKAKFLVPPQDGGSGPSILKGIRLNKLVVKLFEPAIPPHQIDKYAKAFGIWPVLTEWVTEQVQAEGFTVTVDLEKELRGLLVPEDFEGSVKSIIEFPDLGAPEQKAAALSQPSASEDESTDPDDEDKEDAEWLQ